MISKFLASHGTTAYLATTVTASPIATIQAVESLGKLIPQETGGARILGLHLEGPFISDKKRGVHPPEHIRPPSIRIFDELVKMSNQQVKLITVAPENPGGLEFIRHVRSKGIVVSLGHSNATCEVVKQAIDAGASNATHTFNAMRGFHHREAGIAGYALINDSIECELIYDRLHVSKEAVRLLCKAKPNDKLFCVSDSTEATGMAQGHKFMMWGHECVTGKNEVRLVSNGALAGSAVTLLDSFRMLCEDFGEETAIRLCSINPRKAMGMSVFPKVFVELDRKREVVGLRRVS